MSKSIPQYHPVATGLAHETVKAHNEPAEIVLWAGWFCPFSQRTWIALEEKGLPYQYKETNPYLKEDSFIAVSPKGLTPGFQFSRRPLHDSNVLAEFIEDAFGDTGSSLLPKDAYQRAQARLAIDFINKSVAPAFFRLLQAQPEDLDKQVAARREYAEDLKTISSQREGLFFFGDAISLVDIAIAPWAVRNFIPVTYRGFKTEDAPGWDEWAKALSNHPSVKKTTSDAAKYIEFNQTFLRNESLSSVGRAAKSGKDIP